MGTSFDDNFWAEYVYRCILCQTLLLPESSSEELQQLPNKIKRLVRNVFPDEAVYMTPLSKEPNQLDVILDRYVSQLKSRPEYRKVISLVQNHQGSVAWETETLDVLGETSDTSDKAILCTLDCKNYHDVTLIPEDPNERPRHSSSYLSRKGAFHGDKVRVDPDTNCVLLDDETFHALKQSHFGETYLCKVDPNNPTLFIPLNNKHPKFANLPPLSCGTSEKGKLGEGKLSGVVMFKPESINEWPRVNNFIPLQCAQSLYFIVKFLGWKKRFRYPLGIVVGAIPHGYSSLFEDTILQISNNISPLPCLTFDLGSTACQIKEPTFSHAFTIDPKGSTDHDDALSCMLIKSENSVHVYEVGVHITNVHKYLVQGSDLDRAVLEQGCSVYSSSDKCASKMLPQSIIDATSILEGQPRDAFSVLVKVIIQDDHQLKLTKVSITESQVTSALELTYEEAQSLITHSPIQDDLSSKVEKYDSSWRLGIQKKLQILWKVAYYLRKDRLGRAAFCFSTGDPEDAAYPEAHFLIEEFMVWANHRVAKKLVEHLTLTIVRTQAQPNQEQLQLLLVEHGAAMSASLALEKYAEEEQPCEQVSILPTTLNCLESDLVKGNALTALHCIQFEHVHPQFAVVQYLFQQIQSPANYCVTQGQEGSYCHAALQCELYTHFTSPIRRYVDVVIQRMLHAALGGGNSQALYKPEELKGIAEDCKVSLKRAGAFERDVKRSYLAKSLLQGSKRVVCFVAKVNHSHLKLLLKDLHHKLLLPHDTTVRLQHLGAVSTLPSCRDNQDSQVHLVSESQLPKEELQVFQWKVKMASFKGTPQEFLRSPLLIESRGDTNTTRNAYITLYVSDTGEKIKISSNLAPMAFQADVKFPTCAVPLTIWKNAQDCLERGSPRQEHAALSCQLKLVKQENQCTPFYMARQDILSLNSALWIYKIQRPLQFYEVMNVQLTAFHQGHLLTPSIQLLEVAPGLRICVQHNRNPATCFTDTLTINASKKDYKDIEDYFQHWERVLLSEAAINSLKDCEMLILKDVHLHWPELTKTVTPSGAVYYQLETTDKDNGVKVQFPTQFMESSYDFFSFNEGDLACVRYDVSSDNGTTVHCVYHMVVHHVERDFQVKDRVKTLKHATPYLKFVGTTSNHITCEMKNILLGQDVVVCELQLAPLTLPYR